LVVRAVAASVRTPRSRPYVHHSMGKAGEHRLVQPLLHHLVAVRRRATGVPARCWSCARMRRADHNAGCGGSPLAGHGAGTGGYCLARSPSEISLWDITSAIEGSETAFRCTEIRQNGPCVLARKDCKSLCPIAASCAQAERAYRDALKSVSLADIVAAVGTGGNSDHLIKMFGWYQDNVNKLPGN
jgi:Iron-dependent Transcriptional regulator